MELPDLVSDSGVFYQKIQSNWILPSEFLSFFYCQYFEWNYMLCSLVLVDLYHTSQFTALGKWLKAGSSM